MTHINDVDKKKARKVDLIVTGVSQFVFDKGTLCFTRPCVDVLNNTV